MSRVKWIGKATKQLFLYFVDQICIISCFGAQSFGRFKPVDRVVSGAYRGAYTAADEVKKILSAVDEFTKEEGICSSGSNLV